MCMSISTVGWVLKQLLVKVKSCRRKGSQTAGRKLTKRKHNTIQG